MKTPLTVAPIALFALSATACGVAQTSELRSDESPNEEVVATPVAVPAHIEDAVERSQYWGREAGDEGEFSAMAVFSLENAAGAEETEVIAAILRGANKIRLNVPFWCDTVRYDTGKKQCRDAMATYKVDEDHFGIEEIGQFAAPDTGLGQAMSEVATYVVEQAGEDRIEFSADWPGLNVDEGVVLVISQDRSKAFIVEWNYGA